MADRTAQTDAKDAARAVWGSTPAGWTFGEGIEPGTKDWFDAVYERRSRWEQPWLFEVVPFASFGGLDVLELGCGAGYDAFTFVGHGARYTGIDITPENVTRSRANLAFYGMHPTILEGDAEHLAFPDGSFDVVYSNGVLHHTPDIEQAFREALRVLRPGGHFYVIVYNRNSVFYLLNVVVYQHILRGGFRRRSLRARRSMIEHNATGVLPLVNVYTRGQVRVLLDRAGFRVTSVRIRKLVAEELPSPGPFARLWRRVPQSFYDRLAKRWGWYVVGHAIRPWSS